MNVPAILSEIAESAEHDDFLFPTTADIALKLQRILDNPDCTLDQLAALVRADPLLSARVVAIANSAVYNRSGRAMTDARNAVSHIGFNTLRALAAAVVVRQMQGMARAQEHRQTALRLWQHTAHVAALAQVIARRVTHVNADTAFFAGIIHEVGGFYVIARAADYAGLLEGEDASLMAWDEGGAAQIGRAVLRRLGTPATVMSAIEGMWLGYLAMPPRSLADTLLLADQLAPVESPLCQLAGRGSKGHEAHIDVTLNGATLTGILEESATEVQSLIDALHS